MRKTRATRCITPIAR